jgi:hypothetical protein
MKSNSRVFKDILKIVVRHATTLLSQRIFPLYTDHSIEHSKRVYSIVKTIINGRKIKLSNEEDFVLSCATMLHDIGMNTKEFLKDKEITQSNEKQAEIIRNNHNVYSKKYIEKHYIQLGIPEDFHSYVPTIAEIAQNHRKTDLKQVKKSNIHGVKIRTPLLSAILRFADSLDCDSQRISLEELEPLALDADSYFHWLCNLYVQSVEINNNKIKVYFCFPEKLKPYYLTNIQKFVISDISNCLSEVKGVLDDYDVYFSNTIEFNISYTEAIPLPDYSKLSKIVGEITDRINDNFFRGFFEDIADRANEIATDIANGNQRDYYRFNAEDFDKNEYNDFKKEINKALAINVESDTSTPQLGRQCCDFLMIIGEAGIGKTTFLSNLKLAVDTINSSGSEQKLLNQYTTPREYGVFKVDYIDSDDPIDIQTIGKKIQETINKNFLHYKLNGKKRNHEDFEDEIDVANYLYTQIIKFWGKEHIPFILTIDNIDLLKLSYQKQIFKIYANIYSDLITLFNDNYNEKYLNEKFVILFTIRNDSSQVIYEHQRNYISKAYFPKPLVYKIMKSCIMHAVDDLLLKTRYNQTIFNNTSINIWNYTTENNITIEKADDLRKFINDLLTYPETTWRNDFKGIKFQEFNNIIVNYNVRQFLYLFIEKFRKYEYLPMLYNDSYKPFRKYDYFSMLIGKTTASESNYENKFVNSNNIYNNNIYIDRELRTSQRNEPYAVIFNVFETYDFANDEQMDGDNISCENCYENVFMIYIRILQILGIEIYSASHSGKSDNFKKTLNVYTLIEKLNPLFDVKVIIKAIQMMIYTGLLVETKIGSRDLYSRDNKDFYIRLHKELYEDEFVNINGDAIINKTVELFQNNKDVKNWAEIEFKIDGENKPECAGALYLLKLMHEFDYIYPMTSYYVKNSNSVLNDPNKNGENRNYIEDAAAKLNCPDHSRIEKEYSVALFLTAFAEMLLVNINSMSPESRKKFNEIFHKKVDKAQKDLIEKIKNPWQNMIQSVIDTINVKANSSYDINETERTNNERTNFEISRRQLVILEQRLTEVQKEYTEVFTKAEEDLLTC